MTLFKNKYRSESHRHPTWAYARNGLYFLTMVTQNRCCNLGKIINQEMFCYGYGKIVEAEFYKSFEIRKELILHAFVIMPNHIHCLVEIKQKLKSVDQNKF